MFGERQGIENFQRPGRAEWSLNRIAFLICKGIDEDYPLRRQDFAINKFTPHFVAVGSSHAVVKDAARTEIQFNDTRCEAFGPPPSLQALRFGLRLEHELARRIEDARDNELSLLGLRRRSIFLFSHYIYLSACCDQAVDQYDDGAREQRSPGDGDLCPDGCAVRLTEHHVKEKSP